MSDAHDHAHPHPADASGHHETPEQGHDDRADHDDEAGGHGSADDHGHGGSAEPLGPVDTRTWAAAIGGSALAIVVVVAMYVAIAG